MKQLLFMALIIASFSSEAQWTRKPKLDAGVNVGISERNLFGTLNIGLSYKSFRMSFNEVIHPTTKLTAPTVFDFRTHYIEHDIQPYISFGYQKYTNDFKYLEQGWVWGGGISYVNSLLRNRIGETYFVGDLGISGKIPMISLGFKTIFKK